MTASALLLLIADGRFPTGGHAYSGGLEEAVAAGTVNDPPSLTKWLTGRLHTTGRLDAGFARAAAAGDDPVLLEAEYSARTPSAAHRRASRAQGRGLLRTARSVWPGSGFEPLGPLHFAVAVGVVACAAGITPGDAALAAATAAVQGPGWAATRLLGMDPMAVAAVMVQLAPMIDETASAPGLASVGAPLLEIGAAAHANWEVRLFAS